MPEPSALVGEWPPVVGQQIRPFARKTGFEEWNRYAGVTNEFTPTHMDDEAGRQAGFPGAFGLGDLQVAYYHNLLRAWLAGRGRIRSVSCRFHSPNLKDRVVTVSGTVTAVSATTAALDLRAEDDLGVTLSTGIATVTFI